MQKHDAGVLIDDYGLRPDEVSVLAQALQLSNRLALGDFDHLQNFLNVALSVELMGDPDTRRKIRSLLQQLNCVLWEGRTRFTVYDRNRATLLPVIGHGLERRLARDQQEADRVARHLTGDRNYYSFMTGRIEHGDRDEEKGRG